jgi:phosphoribosylformylglycinamidine cyclo-ligase
MAHITGGGLTENIIRVVPEGLGLALDPSRWSLPPVFRWLQEAGRVADAEMWRTFNCGIGYVVIAAPGDVGAVREALDAEGMAQHEIGRVVRATGADRVRIG